MALITKAQQDPTDSVLPKPSNNDDRPKNFKETLQKMRIEKEKKDYQEMLDRGAEALKITEGLTHDLRNPPPGCSFQFRCPHVKNLCRAEKPKLIEYATDQLAACHMYEPNWAAAS